MKQDSIIFWIVFVLLVGTIIAVEYHIHSEENTIHTDTEEE